MATNAPLPKREAKVIIHDPERLERLWCEVIEIDPIMLPVESYAAPTDTIADVYDAGLRALVTALIENDTPGTEYDIVWSDTGQSVKGCCPSCDSIFRVVEGAPLEAFPFGNNDVAVQCGCVDD